MMIPRSKENVHFNVNKHQKQHSKNSKHIQKQPVLSNIFDLLFLEPQVSSVLAEDSDNTRDQEQCAGNMSVLHTASSEPPLHLWGDYVVPVSFVTRHHPDPPRSSQNSDEIHAHLLCPYRKKFLPDQGSHFTA
jgi:hypothetical protein